MNSSVHSNNRTKNILIFGEGITQLYSTTLTAEKMYSISFSASKKYYVCVCIIMELIINYFLVV